MSKVREMEEYNRLLLQTMQKLADENDALRWKNTRLLRRIKREMMRKSK